MLAEGEKEMSNDSSNKALKSLALVKIQWDRNRGIYLDNFLPFLSTLFVRKKYNSIEENETTIKQLTLDFKDEFGLNIPHFPMISIINRAQRKGLIKKEEHEFFPTRKIYECDFSNKIQEQIAKYEKIIEEYIRFSKENYGKESNREHAEKTIIYFLKQHDLDFLFAAYQGSPLPEVSSTKEDLFIFNKFIEHLFINDYPLFHLFLDIVIGHILANAIFYEENLKNFTEPQLRNLNLYLDTRLIFRLAGIEGEEIKDVYDTLLQEFKAQKINIFLFSHTYEEIKSILQGCLHNIENPNYDTLKANSVLRHFKSQGKKESDILMFINSIDNILKENNIKIVEPPDYNQYSAYLIEENKLEEYIVQTYKENSPDFDYKEKRPTILKDIRSISSVYMLRKGQKPANIKQAKCLFVTTNSPLAYATRKFETDIEYKEGFYIPACVTDTFIGTLIWMRNPNKAIEINEKKIIADVYSALQPSEEILKQYVAELEKLKKDEQITEDDYVMLRDSQVAMELLGEHTLGDPQRFTTKTPIDILDTIKSEANKLYIQEKNEHEKTKEELVRDRKENNKKEESYKMKAKKGADIVGVSILVVFILVAVVAWFETKGISRWILSTISAVMGLLGITIPSIKLKVYNCILDKIYGIRDDKHNI
jgi:hypothetical protein